MPVYNTDPVHLRQAIDSVLSQTFTDFEFIIVNDNSTEQHIDAVILSYTDSRIKYSKNDRNMGISAVRNKMIHMAEGEYLAVMDSDDLCHTSRLFKQVTYLDNNPHVSICGTSFKRFGRLFKNNTIHYPAGNLEIKAALFFKCVMHHPSVMIRKETLIKNYVSYDETLISVHDRKLYFDTSSFGELHNLRDVLCYYRLHDGMISKRKRKAIMEEQKRVRGIFLNKMQVSLSNYEMNILDKYVTSGRCRIKNKEILISINEVLTKLVLSNNHSLCFPAKEFAETCAFYFIKRCVNAAIYGRISSSLLLKNTILPVSQVKKSSILRLWNWILR